MPADLILQCEDFIDGLIKLKKKITASEPKSDVRNQLVAQIKAYKQQWSDIGSIAAPVFWNRIKDSKQRRKIVKRNTMTLPLILAEIKECEFGGTLFAIDNTEPSY
jgi:hypothetical protein